MSVKTFMMNWCAAATFVACAFAGQPANAYVGGGYLKLEGVRSEWKGPTYRGWIRAQGHYWEKSAPSGPGDGRNNFQRRLFFAGPAAPASGGDVLVLSVSKKDPALPGLMATCKRGMKVPRIAFAESSLTVRPPPEVGPRPDPIPPWFEYTLHDVEVGCPVLAAAPEQAFTFKFGSIEWLNYRGPVEGVSLTLQPAVLQNSIRSGKTKSYVLSWIANVGNADEKACSTINHKPDVQDYLANLTGADAEKAKAILAKSRGALDYRGGSVARRGPGLLNVCLIPGLVPPRQHYLPNTDLAYGLDLDGDRERRGIRRDVPLFRSYTSPDGRKGIDNQLYTATGCVTGLHGRGAIMDQYMNEEMRNGFISILLTVSGIDDEHNDDSITVSLLYSKDPIAKSATGKEILPDYTYRLTSEPEFAHFSRTLRGRIVNGVIETDPVDKLEINRNYSLLTEIYSARLRLEIQADGSIKGLIGGYEDWRQYLAYRGSSGIEALAGFQCPGLYNALKNAADGLKNPETGEYEGISTAYELEGRPAFLPKSDLTTLLGGSFTHN